MMVPPGRRPALPHSDQPRESPHMPAHSAPFRLAVFAGLAFACAAPAQGDAKADAPAKPAAAATHGGLMPQTAKVNELLAKAWAENNLKPSARTNNWEFLRRVYLDLLGRIATPVE